MKISAGLEELLRLAAALTFIVVGCAAVALAFPAAPWLIPATLIALLLISSVLFNKDLLARLRGASFEQRVAELEAKGKIERQTIRSSRALYFEDLPTGSAVFLIHVPQRSVLCLYGQYLFDWCPIEDPDDDEMNRSRQFPCTEFDLVLRLPQREVIDLALRGNVYEPEIIVPPVDYRDRLSFALEDGRFIPDLSLEQIRSQLLRPVG